MLSIYASRSLCSAFAAVALAQGLSATDGVTLIDQKAAISPVIGSAKKRR
jgi:hypothetical protein